MAHPGAGGGHWHRRGGGRQRYSRTHTSGPAAAMSAAEGSPTAVRSQWRQRIQPTRTSRLQWGRTRSASLAWPSTADGAASGLAPRPAPRRDQRPRAAAPTAAPEVPAAVLHCARVAAGGLARPLWLTPRRPPRYPRRPKLRPAVNTRQGLRGRLHRTSGYYGPSGSSLVPRAASLASPCAGGWRPSEPAAGRGQRQVDGGVLTAERPRDFCSPVRNRPWLWDWMDKVVYFAQESLSFL